MLFAPPAPSPTMSGEAPTPARNPFPFQYKPNTLDRDRIVVPAGWDSWGKIGVLRDGFDAKGWGEAWENDLEPPAEDDPDEPRATRLYVNLVPDQGSKVSCFEDSDIENIILITIAASAITTVQQPHARASFPCQKLRRECTACGQGPSWCFQESNREPIGGYCWTNGQQQFHTTQRGTCTHRDGRWSKRTQYKYSRRRCTQNLRSNINTSTYCGTLCPRPRSG